MPPHKLSRKPAAPGRQRRTHRGAAVGLPQVRAVGWERHRHALPGYLGEHAHRGAYEFCLIVDGRVDWWVENEVYELGPGDVYITRPGERHGGVNDVLHAGELYWLVLAIPRRRALPGATPAETRRLERALRTLPDRSFSGSPRLQQGFAQFMAAFERRDPHRNLAVRVALHALLLELLACHETHRQLARMVSPEIRDAAAHIEQHLAEPLRVSDLAELTGLGVSQFHNRFRQEIGQSPADYRAALRVRHAKRLLRSSDLSITQIAMRVGFSTSQYFATAFRKLTGMTPRDYRTGAAD